MGGFGYRLPNNAYCLPLTVFACHQILLHSSIKHQKMKSRIVNLVLVLSLSTLTSIAQVKVGDKAPDFTANDQDGKKISLHDYLGKKVVLYFYPKDFTGGCTEEACNLRDNNDALMKAGYVILGISSDDETSHKSFKDKSTLTFSLLPDTDNSIKQKLGVWIAKNRDGKKFMGTARTTFLIDEKGVISKIIDKVDTKEHASQILKL